MYLHGLVDAAGIYELALRSVAVARKTGSPDDAAIADSMLGAAYYMRCRSRAGARTSPTVIARWLASGGSMRANTCSICGARRLAFLPNSLFFSGNLDQAAHYAKMNIEEAARSGHPIGLCRALTNSMRLYFWVDDLEQVERNLAKLEHTAERHSLAPFRAVALGLRGRYLIRVGQMADGIQHLQESLEKLAHSPVRNASDEDLVSELTVSLAKQNARPEALALIDRSIAAAGKGQ